MKTQLIALFLVSFTALGIGFFPETGNSTNIPVTPPTHVVTVESPSIEVVFVLDTTSSMSGLIEAAKEKIWSIATSMASSQQAPQIRIGLVAFRDRGDRYITQVTDLSADLDSMYATLMDFQTAGGGDTPESVNAALHAAVNDISWSQDPNTYRTVFLVGDAPPHMDYADEVRYPQTLEQARHRGIVVNTIRCGDSPLTAQAWQQIAGLAGGAFFSVDQSGSAVAIASPFDESLATLSAELDETRVHYGDARSKEIHAAKIAATDKLHADASVAVRARRASFNALESGRKNLFGDNDLVSAVISGEAKLEDLAEEDLPSHMQAMAPQARKDFVAKQAGKRQELSSRIQALTEERDAYLAKESEAIADVGASLDYRMFEAVRNQAAAKGIEYKTDKPKL